MSGRKLPIRFMMDKTVSAAERRLSTRMLCADLVNVEWRDASGHTQRAVANLEDISQAGACLQLDEAIPVHTAIRVEHPRATLMCRVRYCVYREIGYFLGVEFEPGHKWTPRVFKPMHMLDPRKMLNRALARVGSQPAE